jgi:hypothetical protein
MLLWIYLIRRWRERQRNRYQPYGWTNVPKKGKRS